VVQFGCCGILGCGESKIGQESSRPTVAVCERMNPHGFCVDGDTQFMRRPVVGMSPSVMDSLHGGTEFDGNMFGWNADVEFALTKITGPLPDVAIEPTV